MKFDQIIYNHKKVTLHKTKMNPQFDRKTVLANDPWDFVELWLKRHSSGSDAQFYWQQAREFDRASSLLPSTSSPLTTYYSFLNAVKTLLIVKKVPFANRHGVSGKNLGSAVLLNENITFHKKGILPALCGYLEEPILNPETYCLKDILYNLPYIHRAYNITYTSEPELFIPIHEPKFMKKHNTTETWFTCRVDDVFANGHLNSKLPSLFQRDYYDTKCFSIRTKKRIKWISSNRTEKARSIKRLSHLHKRIRQNIFYISGLTTHWYLKRANLSRIINRSSLPLIFAGMHRLSELSRYENILLYKHLNSQENWLLTQFIELSRNQFIDEITSEITGQQIMKPGI
jgi:hypothetical protein